MLWCEKTEEGIPAWLLFTPKPRLRTDCWVRAHRPWHWGEVTSAASSNGGWAAPEPHQIKVTPPANTERSEPRQGSFCSREGGCHAGQSLLPALVCQAPPRGMLPCLSAENMRGQQLSFSHLGTIQPYEFHFMQSKDKLYLQIKHSSYLMFFCSGKIRDPTWWNLHCLKIQGLFTKNTFCWWQSSTP